MLKITKVRTDQRCRLVLEGKLVSPWLDELKREWDVTRNCTSELTLIVDLRNVTTISQEGQNVLLGMMRDGAKFVCGGVLNRHVLKQLAREPTKSRTISELMRVGAGNE
jgi:hypothetical protein